MQMFKFLKKKDDEYVSPNDQGTTWACGNYNTVRPPLVMCKNGLHASPSVSQAAIFASGDVLCSVSGYGTFIMDSDKTAFEKLHIDACWEIDRPLVAQLVREFFVLQGFNVVVPAHPKATHLYNKPVIICAPQTHVAGEFLTKLQCLNYYDIISDIALLNPKQFTSKGVSPMHFLDRFFQRFMVEVEPDDDCRW